jgi:hypothetical protein
MAFKPRFFKNIWAGLKQLSNVGIFPTIPGEGVPVNGPTGTGAKFGGKGQQYVNILTGVYYINTGTAASPTWSPAAGASILESPEAESSRLRKPDVPKVEPPAVGKETLFGQAKK